MLANARLDLKRYQTLWKQNSISQQTLATQVSLVKQYEGAVQVDQGLINVAKVNLIYCRITAPISGRIGLRLIDPGNVVQTSNATGIAVINTMQPITVIFSIPEDSIPDVVQALTVEKTLLVQAFDRQQKRLLAQGKLLTMDNQIDPSTGTVRLKAQFNNKENELFPNQFVNIQLLIKTLHQVTTVPTAAIQYGANGNFVYLLHADNTVSTQSIMTGVTTSDETVIDTGIVAGQSVVVMGADNLSDGAKVEVVSDKASSPLRKKGWFALLRRYARPLV